MSNLALRVCDPFGAPGHPAQAAFLSIDRAQAGTTRSHYVGGRGSGKTTVGIMLMLRSMIEWNPGLPHLWTEPTYRLCHDVFLREWRKIVPSQLYKFHASDMKIVLVNGSELDIRSRNVDNPAKEISKGPNYCAAVDDEAANKYDPDRYWDIDAAVRHPNARCRFHDTLSTPQMGEYYTLCTHPFHTQVNATSFDNPFLDTEFASSLAQSLDPQRARQEIYGEWVALSGRIWDVADLSQTWPLGNLHPHAWQPGKPYTLGCDLGVQSAWLIIQQVPNGHGEPIDVVVAEYLPDDGDAVSVVRQINADYGVPSRVFVGADLNTRSIVDGGTASYVFRKQWGGIPVVPITGDLANKDLQYQVAKGRILNANGARRCCVSAALRTYPERSPRGIKALWQADQWPSGRQVRYGELLPKDKRSAGKAALEDVRDAWLYAMIGLHPPKFVKE